MEARAMRTGRKYSLVSGRRVALVSLICVTLLGACVACSAIANSGDGLAEPETDPWDHFYRYRGFTIWSCNRAGPIYFVRPTNDAGTNRATMAHEASHVAVMLSFPSCEAFHEWARDPENLLTMEAMAWCASIKQRVRDGLTDVEGAAQHAAEQIATGYEALDGVTRERARQRLNAVCS